MLIKIVFISVYISILIKKEIDVIKIFSYIILFFSIASFIIYILVLFNFSIPLVNNDNLPIYLYLMKDYGNDFGGSSFIRRNAGIFFEPGLYQIYINFALIYFLNKKLFIISIFLVLNILLTYSPTGYLLSFIIILFYLFKISIKNILLSILLVTLFVVLLLSSISDFVTMKQDSMSYYLRYTDIVLGTDLFIEKPIIGWGIGNEEMVKSFFDNDINIERGLSNGLLALAYQSGIIGIIFYVIGFVKFIKKETINNKYIIFSSFFILSLLNENIYLSNFFIVIMIYGYIRSKNEKSLIYRA
jgi:hypothetical protein